MTKCIKQFILSVVTSFFLVGCSSNVALKNTTLKNENKELTQQLVIANKTIKAQNELYDLRNILDYKTHMILSELSKGNTDYLKDKITNNITISDNKLVSNSKNKGELEISKEQFTLRQRAYMLSDDKKEFSSIYEFFPIDQSNVLKTLHVYFILDNGQWKLDFIDRAE